MTDPSTASIFTGYCTMTPSTDYDSSSGFEVGGENNQDAVVEYFSRELSYSEISDLDVIELPRGGVTLSTKAVGWIQFGIPPETIKDSIRMGIDVPSIYIVPIERFCRETGTTLGINLAEFEFPAYYNFFLRKKRCTLVVDSDEAEDSIRRVFGETLLGPGQFRRNENPVAFEEEDFSPEFNRDAIPNFQKELQHFRMMPEGYELRIESLLNFIHFRTQFLGSASGSTLTVQDEKAGLRDCDTALSIEHTLSCCEAAVIYPDNATTSQIQNRSCKRVEIIKISGGTEYFIHDIDEFGLIVGKARISGTVKVHGSLSVLGFGSVSDNAVKTVCIDNKEVDTDVGLQGSWGSKCILPPTFYPPSFGVTVLGNSHGFDAKGSVSGYVLWVNGRGIMIDPPPYSSATLEREGIRPRTIVGIILTHCHADHDAGAFQKILTGSRVVVITTPTIYKSFIRKYSALSELSPAILHHSHRYKQAIIGTPLRFQGATFHFTYTLHSIPCVGFRVEWRGRSMVFTGDHFNDPVAIDQLVAKGILSEARANDLRNLPLQDTDLLLHEAGIPPIHTPVEVLDRLPSHVKDRMYVVHTSDLKGRNLRIAPTGTAGTIRLDTVDASVRRNVSVNAIEEMSEFTNYSSSAYDLTVGPPIVALRPTSSSDPWFTLNLLSAVPFLSSLNYASTMDVLEAAKVDNFCTDDVVVPVSRRNEVLCVIWEGTCMERERSSFLGVRPIRRDSIENYRRVSIYQLNQGSHRPIRAQDMDKMQNIEAAVWYAGDWTGPRSLQPEKYLSGESTLSTSHDIVAVSQEGVKVITIEIAILHKILMNGSPLYKRYVENKSKRFDKDLLERIMDHSSCETATTYNIMEVIECNCALRKLSAVQKRHLETLAEEPVLYAPGHYLWQVGDRVEKAFIIIQGAAFFLTRRTNETDTSSECSGEAIVSHNRLTSSEKATYSEDKLPTESIRRHSGHIHRDSVIGRLRNRRTLATGLIFRRGHFLGDISNMVAGLLSTTDNEAFIDNRYGNKLRQDINEDVSDLNGEEEHRKDHFSLHSSTLVAGEQGCLVLTFPKSRLIPFFDEYPGLLLSLLGTQVVF